MPGGNLWEPRPWGCLRSPPRAEPAAESPRLPHFCRASKNNRNGNSLEAQTLLHKDCGDPVSLAEQTGCEPARGFPSTGRGDEEPLVPETATSEAQSPSRMNSLPAHSQLPLALPIPQLPGLLLAPIPIKPSPSQDTAAAPFTRTPRKQTPSPGPNPLSCSSHRPREPSAAVPGHGAVLGPGGCPERGWALRVPAAAPGSPRGLRVPARWRLHSGIDGRVPPADLGHCHKDTEPTEVTPGPSAGTAGLRGEPTGSRGLGFPCLFAWGAGDRGKQCPGGRAVLPVLLRWDSLVPGGQGKQVWGSTAGNVLKKQPNTGMFGTIPNSLPGSRYQSVNKGNNTNNLKPREPVPADAI